LKTTEQLFAELAVRDRCELYMAISMLAALVTFTFPMACALIRMPLDLEVSWVILVASLKALLGLTALRLIATPWL